MRALVLEDFGEAPKVTDVPTPAPSAGEVLVEVQAASVNGFDLAVAGGLLKGMMEYHFPVVIGKDFAGTVAAVGDGVDGFATADDVFGVLMRTELQHGTIAEFVAVPAAIGLAHRPAEVAGGDAGALGLAGATALACVEEAEVAGGDAVLVSGATGGVGSLAVQLSAARGAHVIATARAGEDADFVRGLAAADVVDHSGDLAGQVQELRPDGVDVVLHLAGDPAALAQLVRAGGRLASTVGFTQEQAGDANITVIAIRAVPDARVLTTLASAVADGSLRVPVERSFSLDDAAAALEEFGRGKRGKLGITIR